MRGYFRFLIWSDKDHALMKDSYMRVFGKHLDQKTPLRHRFLKKSMIGTAQMTDEREAAMIRRMGKKITIREKEPFWWVNGR